MIELPTSIGRSLREGAIRIRLTGDIEKDMIVETRPTPKEFDLSLLIKGDK